MAMASKVWRRSSGTLVNEAKIYSQPTWALRERGEKQPAVSFGVAPSGVSLRLVF